MNWFYALKGESVGPYTTYDLSILRDNGDIGPATLVWREGANWAPLGEQPEFAIVATAVKRPPTPPAPPVVTKARAEATPKARAKAAPKPPAEPLTAKEPARLINSFHLGNYRSARFVPRVVARFVDTIIVLALAAAVFALNPAYLLPPGIASDWVAPIRGLAVGLVLIVHAGIVWLFTNSIGKGLIGIKAVPAYGRRRVPFTQILVREFWIYAKPIAAFDTLWKTTRRPDVDVAYEIVSARVIALSRHTRWRTAAVVLFMPTVLLIVFFVAVALWG